MFRGNVCALFSRVYLWLMQSLMYLDCFILAKLKWTVVVFGIKLHILSIIVLLQQLVCISERKSMHANKCKVHMCLNFCRKVWLLLFHRLNAYDYQSQWLYTLVFLCSDRSVELSDMGTGEYTVTWYVVRKIIKFQRHWTHTPISPNASNKYNH